LFSASQHIPGAHAESSELGVPDLVAEMVVLLGVEAIPLGLFFHPARERAPPSPLV
jgi:hypothetical protein